MTEIMPFPENNYETVLLDRPFGWTFILVEPRGIDYIKESIPSSRNRATVHRTGVYFVKEGFTPFAKYT